MVKIQYFSAMAWVQFLVGELRSFLQSHMTKKKKEKNLNTIKFPFQILKAYLSEAKIEYNGTLKLNLTVTTNQ